MDRQADTRIAGLRAVLLLAFDPLIVINSKAFGFDKVGVGHIGN